MHLERTVLINAEIGEVFEFLADVPSCAAWRAGVREIARVTSATGVGAVYRQVVSGPGGHDIDSDVLVTAYEPPNRLEFAVVAGPVRPAAAFDLRPVDDRHTQVTYTIEERPAGLRVLLAPFWNRRLRRELEQLDRLKSVLERETSAA